MSKKIRAVKLDHINGLINIGTLSPLKTTNR